MGGQIRKTLVDALWHGVDPFVGFPKGLIGIDTQGWNSDHPYLTDTITRNRPRTIVEVGVWKGASVITMAKQIRSCGTDGVIIAVDTWLGSSEHWLQPDWFEGMSCQFGHPQIYHKFMANVIESGTENYVIPFPIDSINAASVLRERGISIDMIHIDGGHHYDTVTMDLKAWWPLLQPGGTFVGDDYCQEWSGVKSAIDDFFRHTPHANFEASFPKCRALKI
jgi:cephalosporin hydroxylase